MNQCSQVRDWDEGFTGRWRGKTIAELSGADSNITSNLKMEVEAMTSAMRWLSEAPFNNSLP